MTYSATYDSADMSAIVIDGIGVFGVETIAYAGLIVVVAVLGWLVGKGKGIQRAI